jgi:hypothetical protein
MTEVPLTQGKVALIDDEDAPRVLAHKWTLLTINRDSKVTYYARRSVQTKTRQRSVLLHRFILNAPSGMQVDHINLDGLDNRRANLRLATNAQNHCNIPSRPSRFGFRGVESPKRFNGGYGARIKVNGEIVRIGPFKTAEEAARAYDLLAKHYHGEFATLNFPADEKETSL